MGVLGKANDSIISGAVICRGSDYKGVMDAAPDCAFFLLATGITADAVSRGVIYLQEDRPFKQR